MTDNDVVFTVVLTTLIILLLVAGIAITVFIAGKRQLQQQARLAILQADYERELRVVTHEVQEQTMANIASELHDNIGQLLTSMHLQMEQRRIDNITQAITWKPINETLTHTIEQVRLLGRRLNSDQLEHNGFIGNIEMEIIRLQQLNCFSVHWNHDNTEPMLTKDQRLVAFRIFQELLNNAMKHSNANNITVVLQGKDSFQLRVQDDGAGFDTETAHDGAGLRNMKRRAALSDLAIDIDTVIDQGSIFTLTKLNP